MPKVLNHLPFRMEHLKNLDKPEESLFKVIPYLDKWWVSAGTALGLYRDGDFIPTDTDIDLAVRADINTKPIVIPDMDLIRETYFQDKEGNERICQSAYRDTNNVIVDIFYYHDDINEGELVAISETGIIRKPAFEIKELQTKYGMLPFMHPIEDYLEDRYGDWKTPSNGKYKYHNSL